MEIFADTVFGKLDLSLQKAIADEGYKSPTPVQEQSIPGLLSGRDIVACAQTGTGKTAAFMLPVLQRLIRVRRPRRIGHPRALVVSPTRELAAQTARNAEAYLKHFPLPVACLIGGVSQYAQLKDVKKGAEVVIACPGRLIDFMTQGMVFLDQVECFVLDEADRMLDMGFLPDVRRIMSKLPAKRQSMLFSATLSREIRELAADLVHDPLQVDVSPDRPSVDRIRQYAIRVERPEKNQRLIRLIRENPKWERVLVFVKMRHAADRVAKKLNHAGIQSAAMHSDKTQGQRTRALESFRSGETRVLVATDIASRGIDVADVSCVVNMELPEEIESYVHRIGRTARAGESGAAVSFVSSDQLALLKSTERFIRRSIPFIAEAKEVQDG